MATYGMIDLETLDVTPDAQILTIGAVKFDPCNFDETFEEFYYRFDVDEQEALGRLQSDSTLAWWATQSKAIQEEAFHPDRHSCRTILRELKKWHVGCEKIWSQGEFDTVMIENMCRQLDEPIPWKFWNVENCRTMLNRMPIDPRKEVKFAAHNALEDAKAQVLALRKTFKHFGMTK
jgi:hypothetical protein